LLIERFEMFVRPPEFGAGTLQGVHELTSS
jgi:hypothetical protein